MKKVTISNTKGIKATFTNYGARLMSLLVPDSKGILADVVLGFNEPRQYLSAEEKYFGAIVGRYANRIANGTFSLNGNTYTLTKNNPPNSLHGGIAGFHGKYWDIISLEKNRLVMSCHSKDGEEGFPGNLKVQVSFELTEENAFCINYKVETDVPTPINLTHHSYFNLKGHDQGSILNHELLIHASSFTNLNNNHIPTGKYKSVKGTPFDFRKPTRMGERISSDHPQMELGNGYDHNFVLKEKNTDEIIHAATISEPISGRVMEVHTNQPGIQFYTANGLSGNDIGKSGKAYQTRHAFCLETQHFPDSPNQAHFPSCIVSPNDTYDYSCKYIFSIL